MTYPLISEYVESILNAEDNFKELTHLRPVLNADGTPYMTGGNFAQIFKMQDADTGKLYAVKCFLREQERREENYQRICEELAHVDSPYMVKVHYYEKELYVHTTGSEETEFPVLLMDWVEGVSLDKYLRDNIDDVFELELLTWNFKQLAVWLLEQPFAHGDLKPDNIIVREDGSLVLVDYDGMYVPAMQGENARELGSPDFRHPNRTERDFDKHIDDFPIASILLSLKAIALKPKLLDEYGANDRLLFSEADYRDLSKSAIWHKLILLINSKAFVAFYNVFVMVYAKFVRSKLFIKQLEEIDHEIENVNIQSYLYNLFRLGTLDEYTLALTQIKNGRIDEEKQILFLISEEMVDTYQIPNGIRYISSRPLCNYSIESYHSIVAKEICLPDTVRIIDAHCFEDGDFENIRLSNNLVIIPTEAFINCGYLKSIQLPNSLLYIDCEAFTHCWSLEYINIPQHTRFNEKTERHYVKAIDESYLYEPTYRFTGCLYEPTYRFTGCAQLKQITVDKRNTRYCDEDGVLFSKDKTILLRYPPGKQTKTYTIPETVKTIENYAFAECSNLEHIHIPSSVTEIEPYAFYECVSLKEISIPPSVKKISSYMFGQCKSLQDIKLPNSIQSIGNGAFSHCTNLKNIVLPPSLKYLGSQTTYIYDSNPDGVFENCISLHSIIIPPPVKEIGRFCFNGCSQLQSVTLPNSLEYLDYYDVIFNHCDNLEEIVIHKPLSAFVVNVSQGDTDFDRLSELIPIEKIRVVDNPDFCIIEGAVFSKDKSILFSVPDNYVHYEIPMGVKEIFPLAFKDNIHIERVTIPDSVIKIGQKAFLGCESIHSIVLPCSLTEIGSDAFSWSGLQTITFPDSVSQIGKYAFDDCKSLHSIIIPKGSKEKFQELLRGYRDLLKEE